LNMNTVKKQQHGINEQCLRGRLYVLRFHPLIHS
jgi:hypothetical protein